MSTPYDIYLSYSGRRIYLLCPAQYEHHYILKTPAERDPRSALFGLIIGKLFEWFYERQLWTQKDPEAAVLNLAETAITLIFKEERWDEFRDPYLSAQIREDLRKFVPTGIEVIRKFGFLTPYSRAEADLTVIYTSEKYGLTVKIGGRADFIHSRDQRDVWIIDGKASQHRDKHVDSEQLIWYGVQHYLKYRIAPSRLGFVFYRFPEDPISWVSYDENSFRQSLTQTFDVAKRIHLKQFVPTPSDECLRCDYRGHCSEGSKYVSAKKVADRITESIFDLEAI